MTNLVLVLLESSRPISLREIGSVVAGYPTEPGPLRQAFERDKRALRDGGIPITVDRIDGEEQVGYRIVPEEYYLPDLGLTPAETEAIGFALAAIRLEGISGSDVAEKLGAERFDVPPLAVLPALEVLGPLQDAIRRRAVAHFSYRGRARAVEGDALVFSAGAWYLHGADRTTDPPGGARTFRVDRIAGALTFGPPGEYVPRPSPQTIGAFGTIEDASVVAVVEIDRRAAGSVVELVGADRVRERADDGSVVVEIPVNDVEPFVSFILGLGTLAVVRAPADLRAAVVARLEAVAS
jgi:predicted DNA-binding transcriptional regulator YafY